MTAALCRVAARRMSVGARQRVARKQQRLQRRSLPVVEEPLTRRPSYRTLSPFDSADQFIDDALDRRGSETLVARLGGSNERLKQSIVDALLPHAPALARHETASTVVAHCLCTGLGSVDARAAALDGVAVHAHRFAWHRNGAPMLAHLLEHLGDEGEGDAFRRKVAAQVQSQMPALLFDKLGAVTARACVLHAPPTARAPIMACIQSSAEALSATEGGLGVLAAVLRLRESCETFDLAARAVAQHAAQLPGARTGFEPAPDPGVTHRTCLTTSSAGVGALEALLESGDGESQAVALVAISKIARLLTHDKDVLAFRVLDAVLRSQPATETGHSAFAATAYWCTRWLSEAAGIKAEEAHCEAHLIYGAVAERVRAQLPYPLRSKGTFVTCPRPAVPPYAPSRRPPWHQTTRQWSSAPRYCRSLSGWRACPSAPPSSAGYSPRPRYPRTTTPPSWRPWNSMLDDFPIMSREGGFCGGPSRPMRTMPASTPPAPSRTSWTACTADATAPSGTTIDQATLPHAAGGKRANPPSLRRPLGDRSPASGEHSLRPALRGHFFGISSCGEGPNVPDVRAW